MNAVYVCPQCDEVQTRDNVSAEHVARGDCPSCTPKDKQGDD